jgi:hypothetical protein
MTLIALPTFAHHCIWMFHDGRQAVVVTQATQPRGPQHTMPGTSRSRRF